MRHHRNHARVIAIAAQPKARFSPKQALVIGMLTSIAIYVVAALLGG